MSDSVRINLPLRVTLRSRWQMQQQAESSSDSNWQMLQRATRSSGKPLEQNWNETKSRNESLQEDDRVEITASIFKKIDLMIDDILEKSNLSRREADEGYFGEDSKVGRKQSRSS